MDRKILIDLLDDFAFGSHDIEQTADRITEPYKQDQALQLQQTGVSGSVLKGFDLVKECAKLIVETQNGSVSLLQRRLDLSYNKASRIMDVLEEIKIVDQFSGEKKREVFIKNLEDLIPKLDEINVYNCRFI